MKNIIKNKLKRILNNFLHLILECFIFTKLFSFIKIAIVGPTTKSLTYKELILSGIFKHRFSFTFLSCKTPHK